MGAGYQALVSWHSGTARTRKQLFAAGLSACFSFGDQAGGRQTEDALPEDARPSTPK